MKIVAGWWLWCFFVFLALIVGASAFVSGGAVTNDENNGAPRPTTHRKMKENGIHGRGGHRAAADVSLDDYRPVDPSPSSKAVKPGPIQHGTPLNPYIPKPEPPPPPYDPKFADYNP